MFRKRFIKHSARLPSKRSHRFEHRLRQGRSAPQGILQLAELPVPQPQPAFADTRRTARLQNTDARSPPPCMKSPSASASGRDTARWRKVPASGRADAAWSQPPDSHPIHSTPSAPKHRKRFSTYRRDPPRQFRDHIRDTAIQHTAHAHAAHTEPAAHRGCRSACGTKADYPYRAGPELQTGCSRSRPAPHQRSWPPRPRQAHGSCRRSQ